MNASRSPVGDHAGCPAQPNTTWGSDPSDRAIVSPWPVVYATRDPSREYVAYAASLCHGSGSGALPSSGTSTLGTINEVPFGIQVGS